MLVRISIDNFAIIDQIEVEFAPGLNILSGETGAGKSILIDALILALGGKASAEQVRSGARYAEVKAFFELESTHPVKEFLKEQGLEETEELILTRQVQAEGKSRAWINGRALPVSLVYQLGRTLVDIYGQHEYQTLLEPEQHLRLLDSYAGLEDKLVFYQKVFQEFQNLAQQYEKMRMSDQERREREDFLRFRLSELKRAQLKPGEEEELEQERERLKHLEVLRQASESAFQELYNRDNSIAEQLARIQVELERVGKFEPRLSSLSKNLSEAKTLVEESGIELGNYLRSLEADPGRLEEVEERIADIRRLKRKYQMSVDQLLELAEATRKELEDLSQYESRAGELAEELAEKKNQLQILADELTKERTAQGKSLAQKMKQALKELGMEKCEFEVRVEKMASLGPEGQDRAEFFISPNPGEELKPLSKIASGGELSRIMLALRGILARKFSTSVMIFDEVDAGIGGAIAEVVGKKLKELAARNQVLCVTHLAQIARFADHHLWVWKQMEKDRTVTRVKSLSKEERIEELARMLGGVKITEKTRAYAREMLEESQR